MTSLYTGSTLFICKNNKDMFRDTAVFKPTIMVMVPALAEMALTLSKQFGKNMLGDDMKTIIAGAAAVPPYLVQEYDKLGIKLLPGYGLTESANLVSGNPESLKFPDSVGYPFPNQELKIVDGELWLKGKNMMDGYIGEDEADVYEDGWFKTSSTATIWMAASRVRRSRTVFQSDRSLQAARMESAWRGDSGLPAPIRPLSEP